MPEPSRAVLVALALLVTWRLAAAGSGQDAPAASRFTSTVDQVAVYATVIGEDGQLVRNLTASDFDLKVDGRPQRITVFQAGRLPISIVVLLDDSPSMRRSTPDVATAARALIARLAPGDRATVGVFSRTVGPIAHLTFDREELVRRLAQERPEMAGTALWDGLNAGMTVLENEPGRRVVLAISDGDDNTSHVSAEYVVQRAVREGVMVYGVGVKSGEGRLRKSLEAMARDSGGYFVQLRGSDDLRRTFQRVVDELHTQYLLGFEPVVRDGRSHRIDLKVKRSGTSVRFRQAFVAAADR